MLLHLLAQSDELKQLGYALISSQSQRGRTSHSDLEVMAPRCAICSPISGPLSSCAILVLVDTVDGVGPPLGTPGALGAMSSSACTKACASPRLSSAAGLNWMFRRSSEPAQIRLQAVAQAWCGLQGGKSSQRHQGATLEEDGKQKPC